MIKNKYFRIGSLAGGMRVEEVAEEYGSKKKMFWQLWNTCIIAVEVVKISAC